MSESAVNPGTAEPSPAPTTAPEPSAAPPAPAAPAAPAVGDPSAAPSAAPLTEPSAAPPTEPSAAEPRGTSRTGFAVRAGAAVVAAALVGVGLGLGIIKVRYDQDPAPAAAAPAPTATASPSPSFGAKSNGSHFGSMRDLLLPVPTGYKLGPDSGAYGNDTELTDDQRKAWVEDDVRALPPKLQDMVRKVWEDTPLKGGGVRSLVSGDNGMVVTVWLLQYHQEAVKADNAWAAALGSDSGLFRVGPDVPGHTEAHCYLPYMPPGSLVDTLSCSAAEGDLRVVVRVEGVAPLPKDKVVTLFTQQLDRLARPGASV
ncbi:hypothetical protein AB0K43_06330 [Kitasatospora sp. NPDC049258]|uniref:hypothetical protein n=1 Tax=Kitasatospora sp. NPDC049258 TaxID=3155394 RepID=UPI00341B70CD